MTEYRTKEGDTADLIAWSFYGRQDGGVVEQLLEANPGLADYGPIIPAGILINLPDVDDAVPATSDDAVKLWD